MKASLRMTRVNALRKDALNISKRKMANALEFVVLMDTL